MNCECHWLYNRYDTTSHHSYGFRSCYYGAPGRFSYGTGRCERRTNRKRQMNHQGCPYRSSLWAFGVRNNYCFMKYIGYIILSWSLETFASSGEGLKKIFENNHGLPWESIKPWQGESSVTKLLTSTVSTLQDITAIVSVIGVCLVGILYIMSLGEEEKTQNAKKYLMAIIIGLVLALSAWALISLVDLVPTTIKF